MHTKYKTHERGMALVLALFFVTVAISAISAIYLRLANQRNHVSQFIDYKTCFQGLEAAYTMSLAELEEAEDGHIGMSEMPVDANGALALPAFGDEGLTPVSLTGSPAVQYFAVAQDWFQDNIDNNADGAVDDGSERFMYTIHAFAKNQGMERQSQVVLAAKDVNVWRNAIFAGAGQAGGVINGNVSIHGSVHILGDHVVAGGQALAAIDLSGTSLIHNNYDGMPADLQQRVPTLATRMWNGESVETLNGELRVKNGLVGMSGNSEIGSPDVPGNNLKETMDGAYVNDGWTGNDVIDDGDRGDPQSVSSDNGWDELYDLGDRVGLPILTDDWRDPNDGHREWSDADGDWYNHRDYFTEVLTADPLVDNDGIYNGDILLNARGDDFYWNATTGEVLTGSLPASLPAGTDDYLYFDAAANVLLVNGQLTINGNLTMKGQGGDTTINYSGRAAMLVEGNVTLDANLVTCNNGDPNDVANSFPVNNILGIMAAQDMSVGTTSQLDLMGAFYAQGQIVSQKQTNVLGTFVSSYFDMGTNVPSIFQVPSLADNLPHGMIGNYPILAFQELAWREIGVQL